MSSPLGPCDRVRRPPILTNFNPSRNRMILTARIRVTALLVGETEVVETRKSPRRRALTKCTVTAPVPSLTASVGDQVAGHVGLHALAGYRRLGLIA